MLKRLTFATVLLLSAFSSLIATEGTRAGGGPPRLDSEPALTISPASGLPGATVTATLAGYEPGQTLELHWSPDFQGDVLLRTVTVSSSGEASVSFTIPVDAPPGPTTIYASGTFGMLGNPVGFMTPGCWQSHNSFRPGDPVFVNCGGFSPGADVAFYMDDVLSSPLATTTADGDGSVQFAIILPDVLFGAHRLIGTDLLSEYDLPLDVVAAMTIIPSSGPAGSTANAELRGFGAGEDVAIAWSLKSDPGYKNANLTAITAVRTSSTGTAAATFPIPGAAGDRVFVYATGSETGAQAFDRIDIREASDLAPTATATAAGVPSSECAIKPNSAGHLVKLIKHVQSDSNPPASTDGAVVVDAGLTTADEPLGTKPPNVTVDGVPWIKDGAILPGASPTDETVDAESIAGINASLRMLAACSSLQQLGGLSLYTDKGIDQLFRFGRARLDLFVDLFSNFVQVQGNAVYDPSPPVLPGQIFDARKLPDGRVAVLVVGAPLSASDSPRPVLYIYAHQGGYWKIDWLFLGDFATVAASSATPATS